MKRFRELTIHLSSTFDIEKFISCLSDSLAEHWQRNGKLECGIATLPNFESFCFSRTLSDGLDSNLWLTKKDDKTLHVTNILPTEKSSLSIKEYNYLLNDFIKNSVLSDSLNVCSAEIELTNEEYQLEDLINAETAEALRVFSSLANKSTGSSHPCDRIRWYAFLLLAYKEVRDKFSPEEVMKYLIEDGWSTDFATELAIEYEFGIELLEYAEDHNVFDH